MTMCKMIDHILKTKKMSRRKLAIKAGIPPSSFQSAMARGNALSLDMLIPVLNALGVSLDDIAFEMNVSKDNLFQMLTSEDAKILGKPARVGLLLAGEKAGANEDMQLREEMEMLLIWVVSLNREGQEKALERVQELTEIPRYIKQQDE